MKLKTCNLKLPLLVHPFRRESAAANMAADLWSFLEHPRADHPRFRRFGWLTSCATFGYGQQYDWVTEETGRPPEELCRRPTGGGIVEHGEDWTYSLILPAAHPVCVGSASEIYLRAHEALAAALGSCGVETNLLPCGDKEGACPGESRKPRKIIPGQCFLEPVGRDVMLPDGRTKVAGAAMKRTRAGLLLQGTIDRRPLPELDWATFETKYLSALAEYLSARAETEPWPENFDEARFPYVEQFASEGWLKERKAMSSRK